MWTLLLWMKKWPNQIVQSRVCFLCKEGFYSPWPTNINENFKKNVIDTCWRNILTLTVAAGKGREKNNLCIFIAVQNGSP